MKMNLWDPLSRHLTAFQLHLIEQVSDAAGRLKMPIYIVGGVVRDLLLDRPIKDLDIVVEGDAIRLGKEVVSLYQGRLVTHPQFFTAYWESEEDPDPDIPIEGWGPRMSLDLISARSEIYPSPAVLPEVRMGSIEDDLQRRDFTLNTLAVRLDGEHRGELLDRCGGLQDLKDGILRTLHERSFIDDPTRIFRGIRFEGRFGFAFAPDTMRQLEEQADGIANLTGPRIWHELWLYCSEPFPEKLFSRIADLGITGQIHPGLIWTDAMAADCCQFRTGFPGREPLFYPGGIETGIADEEGPLWVWFSALPRETVRDLGDRLQLSGKTMEGIEGTALMRAEFPAFVEGKASEAVFFLEKVPLSALYCYSRFCTSEKEQNLMRDYLLKWWFNSSKITGNDLKKMGFGSGPKIGRVLKRLRAAWIDGEIRTEQEETALLEQLRREE